MSAEFPGPSSQSAQQARQEGDGKGDNGHSFLGSQSTITNLRVDSENIRSDLNPQSLKSEPELEADSFSSLELPFGMHSTTSIPGSWPDFDSDDGSPEREWVGVSADTDWRDDDAGIVGQMLERFDVWQEISTRMPVVGKLDLWPHSHDLRLRHQEDESHGVQSTSRIQHSERTADTNEIGPGQGESEANINYIDEIRKHATEMHEIMNGLAAQNISLASALGKGFRASESRLSEPAKASAGLDQEKLTDGATNLQSSSKWERDETGQLKVTKKDLEKRLSEAESRLQKEVKQRKKEVEHNWELEYDIIDQKTEVDKLEKKLMRCICMGDDDETVQIRGKTALEKEQEETIERLRNQLMALKKGNWEQGGRKANQ